MCKKFVTVIAIFLGVALRDSPVGLAAYIIEKFTTWTNLAWKNLEDGGLTKKYSYEMLLDNVMIYWVTRSITTSMRLYAETFNKASASLASDRYVLFDISIYFSVSSMIRTSLTLAYRRDCV